MPGRPHQRVSGPDDLPPLQRDAWKAVSAFLEANPGRTPTEAFKALRIRPYHYWNAKQRLKEHGIDVGPGRDSIAFAYPDDDQIRPGDAIIRACARRRTWNEDEGDVA